MDDESGHGKKEGRERHVHHQPFLWLSLIHIFFNSVRNINLRTVIGYHKDDEAYNFLDDYDARGNHKREAQEE